MADTPALTPERQALLEALASQAAAWWREKTEGPGYLSKFDNGDRSEAGELAQLLASMTALKSPQAPASSFDRFELLLQAAVLARLLREPEPAEPGELVLDVDYGPCRLLGDAAWQAGVAGFPWKTTMWVRWAADSAACYLEVKTGYGTNGNISFHEKGA